MSSRGSTYDTVEVDGGKIAYLRREVNLSQEKLAEKVGVSRGSISMIEIGRQPRVNREIANRLAKALQVRLAGLSPGLAFPSLVSRGALGSARKRKPGAPPLTREQFVERLTQLIERASLDDEMEPLALRLMLTSCEGICRDLSAGADSN